MKYNRSEIMKAAWSNYRIWQYVPGYTFARALQLAWHYAKKAAEEAEKAVVLYNVVGYKLHNGSERVIASGVDSDTAARLKWENGCQYDVVEIRKIA